MRTTNYFFLLLFILSAKVFAQTDDLIIKRVLNESQYSPSFTSDSFYFSFVELEVLNATIDLNDYKLKYKNGATNTTTTKSIGAMFTKTVDSYTSSTPNTSTSDNTSLAVGSSFYFVEMYKVGVAGKLTLSNVTFYKVFAEYMGFTEAQMIDKKYFTVATAGTQNFDSSLSNSSSVITIRNGTTSEDVWENGLADDTYDLRTTLIPTTTYNAAQWNVGLTLVVSDNAKEYENESMPSLISAGTEMIFKDDSKKYIRIYDFSGVLIDEKKDVSERYLVPANLNEGVYIFKVQSVNGLGVYKVIVK